MSLCPWYSKCHSVLDIPNVTLFLIFQMSLCPWYPKAIVSKQSHLVLFTRYKVMVQVADRVFWYHAIRWRHRPTYCITRCKDDQCRALWRHWPSSAGVRPIFWKRVLSIFWNTDNETMQYHFILEWQRLHFYRIVVQMLVSYRNKCPNLHRPVRIRFSRERQCFWNVWYPVRSNNVETTFVCFLSCRCKVWCGVVGVSTFSIVPLRLKTYHGRVIFLFKDSNGTRISPRVSSRQVSTSDGATVSVDVGPRMSACYL